MNKNKIILPVIVSLLVSSFFFVQVKQASALTFNEVVDSVKKIFTSEDDNNIKDKEFTLDSTIALVPGGDTDMNNIIDAGDTIRFTYKLSNTTDQAYTFSTLKTNIDKKELTYVHNLYGVTGISNDDKSIVFTNFRMDANSSKTISFDAVVKYYTDVDPTISTEVEFISKEQKLVAKAVKKEIKAKRIAK